MFKSRKSKIIGIVITALLVVIGLFAVLSYMSRPTNLGAELEYIGKRHTGCPLPLPLGYLLMCSTGPGEEYYFGTDMGREELIGYFSKAQFIAERPRLYPSVERALEKNDFSFRLNDKVFIVNYYLNKSGVSDLLDLSSVKKNIISIDKKDYQEAQNAL